MLVFSTKTELNTFLKPKIKAKQSIGFIPTMGALHNGHLSLFKESVKENAVTVVSIYVNPTQFNNAEDLEKYPRSLESDIEKVKSVSDAIIIFTPTTSEIYSDSVSSQSFNFSGLENQMEGKHRPGHFNGVGTIVKRLFEIVKPNKAYFGEKDFQQLQIVRKLVENYAIPVQIIGCPIHREPNGLAMSSRNTLLSKKAKTEAAIIYKTLKEAKDYFKNHTANTTIKWVENKFKQHPNFTLEYFEIADENSLLPCKRKSKNKKYRGFIAVFIENIRLIDNISL